MRKWLIVVIALAVLLAGWSPASKEPEGLALVRVLGVDGAGPVVLTAVCGGEDQEDPSRGQCAGTDFDGALSGLPWAGGRSELSLTSVSWLIVGRDVDLETVLTAALRDEEIAAAATVWRAEEGAAELLERCDDPASALELLERRGIEAPTVVQALAALEKEELALPLLAGRREGPILLDWEEWGMLS